MQNSPEAGHDCAVYFRANLQKKDKIIKQLKEDRLKEGEENQ